MTREEEIALMRRTRGDEEERYTNRKKEMLSAH
jgi:hypothetical protein